MLDGRKNPEKLASATNVALALGVHFVFFGICALMAAVSFKPKEEVIPIDMTVVLHENLDGDENEPPPVEKPPETPPPPAPKPVEETPPPPPPEKVPDALINEEKPKEEKPKAEKPKPEKPKEEKPKKSAKELREERMKRMLESAKVVKAPKEPPPRRATNGRTGRKTLSDDEIQKLLAQGYTAGRTEQLATSDLQHCISIITKTFHDKWESPPYSTSLREMILSVQFDASGRVVDWRLKQSSGDPSADATVKRAAALVKRVRGLSDAFLREYKTVDVKFTVKPQW